MPRPSSLILAAALLSLAGSLAGCGNAQDEVPALDSASRSVEAQAGQSPDRNLLSDQRDAASASSTTAPQGTTDQDTTDQEQSGKEIAASEDNSSDATPPPLHGQYEVKVITSIPHDPEAFTQGLELVDGYLLESQGLRGASARAWIDPQTGSTNLYVAVQDEEIFAEGITAVDDHFVQLSWTSGFALTGSLQTLAADEATLKYTGEGWGLCFDGTHLVRSDGSSRLTFHDPKTFEEIRSITVYGDDGSEIDQINELECVGSQVLANVWGWDHILAINAKTGALEALIDATSLRPTETPFELNYALNGIAYDRQTNQYYLTGKRWPVIYLVRFEPTA